MATIVKVRCTYFVEVEFPDDDDDDFIYFDIEDNHCPGTGRVGAATDKLMDLHNEQSTCWACAARGSNKIISITRGASSCDSANPAA